MAATMTTKSKTILEQQVFKNNNKKLKAKGEVLPIGMKMNGYETFTNTI
jgi:hypothetical protein